MSSKRDRQKREERAKARQRQAQDDKDRPRTKKMYMNLAKLKGDVDFFKSEKRNLVSIIPFEITNKEYKDLRTPAGKRNGTPVGDTDYKLEIPIHRDMGPEGLSFMCPNEGMGLRCFPCEQKSGLSWPEDKEEIKVLNTSWRCFYNVRNLNAEDEDAILLWEVSYNLFEREMLEEIKEIKAEEDREIYIGILSDSCSVKFRGVDKTIPNPRGGGTIQFHEYKSFDFPKRDDLKDDIIEEAFTLDKLFVIPTYEQTKAWFLGMVPDDDEDTPEPKEKGDGKETSESEKDDIVPPEEEKESKDTETPKEGSWDELDDMDQDEMLEFMKKHSIRIRGSKRMKEKELRKELKKLQPEEEETTTPEGEEGNDENVCPSGHKYGYDNDDTADCDKCKLWQECASKQDELRKEGELTEK